MFPPKMTKEQKGTALFYHPLSPAAATGTIRGKNPIYQ